MKGKLRNKRLSKGEGNGMDKREHLFLSISLTSNFHSLEIGRNEKNEIRFSEFLTKTPKIPLYIQPFVLKQRSNSSIVIKWFDSIRFHFISIIPKQDYLHSIHFHYFPLLYLKTSNQGYFIQFHFILFH